MAALRDRRCLPHLVERVNRVEQLDAGYPFGAELVPHVLAKLAEPLPPEQASALLLGAAAWGDPRLLMRQDAAEVVDRLWRAGAHSELVAISHRVSMRQRASPEMRDRLRVLATEAPVRLRQHAQFALLDAPQNGVHGWRADATACAWLGRLGAAATEAVPVLRALLSETGEPGEARADAAEAYWRVTGDATTALSIVEPLGSLPGDLGTRAREVADRIRA